MKKLIHWSIFVLGVLIMALGLQEIFKYSRVTEELITEQNTLILLLEEKESNLEKIMESKEALNSIGDDFKNRIGRGIVFLIGGGLFASFPCSVKQKTSEPVAGGDATR